jgi:hypothetical protein
MPGRRVDEGCQGCNCSQVSRWSWSATAGQTHCPGIDRSRRSRAKICASTAGSSGGAGGCEAEGARDCKALHAWSMLLTACARVCEAAASLSCWQRISPPSYQPLLLVRATFVNLPQPRNAQRTRDPATNATPHIRRATAAARPGASARERLPAAHLHSRSSRSRSSREHASRLRLVLAAGAHGFVVVDLGRQVEAHAAQLAHLAAGTEDAHDTRGQQRLSTRQGLAGAAGRGASTGVALGCGRARGAEGSRRGACPCQLTPRTLYSTTTGRSLVSMILTCGREGSGWASGVLTRAVRARPAYMQRAWLARARQRASTPRACSRDAPGV